MIPHPAVKSPSFFLYRNTAVVPQVGSRWLIGVTLSHFVERAHRLLGPQKVKDEVRGFHFRRKLRISGFLFSDDDRGGDKLFLRHKLTVLLIYTLAGEDHTLSLNQLKDTIF
jgi:hypothetical protein